MYAAADGRAVRSASRIEYRLRKLREGEELPAPAPRHPLLVALENAPLEDEEISEAEERAAAEGREDIRAGRVVRRAREPRNTWRKVHPEDLAVIARETKRAMRPDYTDDRHPFPVSFSTALKVAVGYTNISHQSGALLARYLGLPRPRVRDQAKKGAPPVNKAAPPEELQALAARHIAAGDERGLAREQLARVALGLPITERTRRLVEAALTPRIARK